MRLVHKERLTQEQEKVIQGPVVDEDEWTERVCKRRKQTIPLKDYAVDRGLEHRSSSPDVP
jgi:hypothetical protein